MLHANDLASRRDPACHMLPICLYTGEGNADCSQNNKNGISSLHTATNMPTYTSALYLIQSKTASENIFRLQHHLFTYVFIDLKTYTFTV